MLKNKFFLLATTMTLLTSPVWGMDPPPKDPTPIARKKVNSQVHLEVDWQKLNELEKDFQYLRKLHSMLPTPSNEEALTNTKEVVKRELISKLACSNFSSRARNHYFSDEARMWYNREKKTNPNFLEYWDDSFILEDHPQYGTLKKFGTTPAMLDMLWDCSWIVEDPKHPLYNISVRMNKKHPDYRKNALVDNLHPDYNHYKRVSKSLVIHTTSAERQIEKSDALSDALWNRYNPYYLILRHDHPEHEKYKRKLDPRGELWNPEYYDADKEDSYCRLRVQEDPNFLKFQDATNLEPNPMRSWASSNAAEPLDYLKSTQTKQFWINLWYQDYGKPDRKIDLETYNRSVNDENHPNHLEKAVGNFWHPDHHKMIKLNTSSEEIWVQHDEHLVRPGETYRITSPEEIQKIQKGEQKVSPGHPYYLISVRINPEHEDYESNSLTDEWHPLYLARAWTHEQHPKYKELGSRHPHHPWAKKEAENNPESMWFVLASRSDKSHKNYINASRTDKYHPDYYKMAWEDPQHELYPELAKVYPFHPGYVAK